MADNPDHQKVRVNSSKLITVRFPVALADRIVQDVKETGDFRTVTEWLQCATREYLKIREKERSGGGGPIIVEPRLKNLGFFE